MGKLRFTGDDQLSLHLRLPAWDLSIASKLFLQKPSFSGMTSSTPADHPLYSPPSSHPKASGTCMLAWIREASDNSWTPSPTDPVWLSPVSWHPLFAPWANLDPQGEFLCLVGASTLSLVPTASCFLLAPSPHIVTIILKHRAATHPSHLVGLLVKIFISVFHTTLPRLRSFPSGYYLFPLIPSFSCREIAPSLTIPPTLLCF